MTTLQLSGAFADFEEALDDIRDALAVNIKADLDALPPIFGPQEPTFVEMYAFNLRKKLRAMEVAEITVNRLKVIRRIEARKAFFAAPPNPNTLTESDKQRAKDVPVSDVYDGKLKGGTGLCPFHEEKTPSFHINKKKNTWKCYGCDTFGDTIDFVMKRDGVPFLEAVRKLI